MISISLCMIVKNEEKTIERCLDCVSPIVDEIIIVDTGSTDQTKALCTKYTDKIYDFPWVNDFSQARNFSFSKATKDYILWLDADDIVLPKDVEKFLDLKQNLPSDIDAVMMKYNTGFDEHGNVTFSYYRERLSRRSKNYQWKEPVHEYLEIPGAKTLNADICITHGKVHSNVLSTRNIDIYESILKEGRELSPRGIYYYARELKTHQRYQDAAIQFEKFLDSKRGWVEDNITACGELSKCYKALNQPDKALSALFRSFSYDTPRGEICCLIGYHFLDLKNYKLAAYWFELVLSLKKPKDSWGFIHHDSWDYIPLIECAVCYDRLGEHKKAADFNDRALIVKPTSKAALSNKKYFDTILNQGG